MLDWYQRYLVDTGRSAALWGLIGVLVTYGVVRWITLRIRAARMSGRAADGPVKDVYKLTYVRGPSGIIVMLAEGLKKS